MHRCVCTFWLMNSVVRNASEQLPSNFQVPGELSALWRYYGEMYNLDAFTQSCPADQDIINHYKLQQGTKMTKREELEAPSFTNTVPMAV